MHTSIGDCHLGAVEKESAAEIANRSGRGLPSSGREQPVNAVNETVQRRPAPDYGWIKAAICVGIALLVTAVVRGRQR